MRPVAQLLLALAIQPFAIGNVSDIPKPQLALFLSHTPCSGSPTHFVQHVSLPVLVPGQEAIFLRLQPAPFARPFGESGLGLTELGQAFVSVLAVGFQFAAAF